MPILAKFEKQPADRQDFDIDFADYLAGLSDTGLSAVVEAEPGIDLVLHSLIGNTVKVWLAGGVDGSSYKVSVTLTTVGGRIKQVEFVVKVKEV